MRYRGSYLNGFAPRDVESAYPELWRGCVGAWCPSLGPTGLVLRDWSGRQNHGTLTGTTLDTVWSNQQGYCLSSDGTDDNVAIPALSLGTAFSLSQWIKVTAFDEQYQTFFARETGANSIQLCLLTTGKLWIYIDTSGGYAYYDAGAALSVGTWYHVVVTYDATAGLAVYLDSAVYGTAAANGAMVTASIPFAIGGNPNYGASRFFNGSTDDVRLYDRILTYHDRSLLYSNGRGRGIAYSFNHPRGAVTPGDSSGSSGGTFPGLAWRGLRKWRFVVRAGVDGNWPRVT